MRLPRGGGSGAQGGLVSSSDATGGKGKAALEARLPSPPLLLPPSLPSKEMFAQPRVRYGEPNPPLPQQTGEGAGEV